MNSRDRQLMMMLAAQQRQPGHIRRRSGCGCGPLLFFILLLPLDAYMLGKLFGWW